MCFSFCSPKRKSRKNDGDVVVEEAKIDSGDKNADSLPKEEARQSKKSKEESSQASPRVKTPTRLSARKVKAPGGVSAAEKEKPLRFRPKRSQGGDDVGVEDNTDGKKKQRAEVGDDNDKAKDVDDAPADFVFKRKDVPNKGKKVVASSTEVAVIGKKKGESQAAPVPSKEKEEAVVVAEKQDKQKTQEERPRSPRRRPAEVMNLSDFVSALDKAKANVLQGKVKKSVADGVSNVVVSVRAALDKRFADAESVDDVVKKEYETVCNDISKWKAYARKLDHDMDELRAAQPSEDKVVQIAEHQKLVDSCTSPAVWVTAEQTVSDVVSCAISTVQFKTQVEQMSTLQKIAREQLLDLGKKTKEKSFPVSDFLNASTRTLINPSKNKKKK